MYLLFLCSCRSCALLILYFYYSSILVILLVLVFHVSFSFLYSFYSCVLVILEFFFLFLIIVVAVVDVGRRLNNFFVAAVAAVAAVVEVNVDCIAVGRAVCLLSVQIYTEHDSSQTASNSHIIKQLPTTIWLISFQQPHHKTASNNHIIKPTIKVLHSFHQLIKEYYNNQLIKQQV